MSGHSKVEPKGNREEHRVRDKKENHAIVIPNMSGEKSPISIHTRKHSQTCKQPWTIVLKL